MDQYKCGRCVVGAKKKMRKNLEETRDAQKTSVVFLNADFKFSQINKYSIFLVTALQSCRPYISGYIFENFYSW